MVAGGPGPNPWLFADGWVRSVGAGVPLDRVKGLSALSLAESLPLSAGKPVLLAAHLERLAEGCRALAWRPPDRSLIRRVCGELPKRNRLRRGSLRLRWWGGLAQPLLLAQSLPARPLSQSGLALMTSAVRHYGPDSLNARAKVAHMLPNWLAKAETQAWAEDGLRLTPDGLVAEGVWSNVVAVKKRVARTTPLAWGVLEGVTRARLLDGFRRRGFKVLECPVTRHDLWTADAVWVTSSLRGPVKVLSVDGRPLGPSKDGR